ncbi:unnamed protein product [Rotaria sordida]|uniref:F-box domain-containing protein n=1 Tax=Rotaria sordida TaxID=392033 RepID=A0A814KQJ0_9BILA|nr:unnamed protein product [Rotaria sordida]CAF1052802.1 unnamed protein product [Rotaria sordida]
MNKEKNKLKKLLLEHVPNEIFFEIFEYMEFYEVYYGFYHLNKRFKNLIMDSKFLSKINIPYISKLNFELFYQNIIIKNEHHIKILILLNIFLNDIILSSFDFSLKFINLKILIINHINENIFDKIFDELKCLYGLNSLTIKFNESIENLNKIFSKIISLSKLKYFKIKYQTIKDQNQLINYFNKYNYSKIEYLIIEGNLSINSLNNLLYYFSKLHHLSINYLFYSHHDIQLYSSIQLKNLKYVSLKIYLIKFNQFEKIIKNLFYHVEIFKISTHYDEKYLDAKKWEYLITSYMPKLRIFDINHDGFISENELTYHDVINQFKSSFWMEKKWFFKHEHNWLERLNSGVFYSTQPYSRIVPLSQLTKLIIKKFNLDLNEMIDILYSTSELQIFKCDFLSLDNFNSIETGKHHAFEHVLEKNKIKMLHLRSNCTSEKLRLVIDLFHEIKHLTIGIQCTQMIETTKYLLSYKHKLRHLFFLCISDISEVYIKNLINMIEKEKLVITLLNLLNRCA